MTSQKRQLALHCGLVDSHFFLSEVLCGTEGIQTLHRERLLALADFNNFAQVLDYTAVCSSIPTSKYRSKPLALCTTVSLQCRRTADIVSARESISETEEYYRDLRGDMEIQFEKVFHKQYGWPRLASQSPVSPGLVVANSTVPMQRL